jgi:protein tyrosine phosphatase
MLTTLVEKGKVKSSQYWPDENNELFGDHEVTMRSEEEFEHFTLRTLSLQSPDQEERDITHIQVEMVKHARDDKDLIVQVKGWGDYSVPESTATLLAIIKKVREISTAPSSSLPIIRSSEPYPILVHCSAGVGRTGTFIATFRHISSIHSLSLFGRPSIWDTVVDMRRARPKMVQNKDQYLYTYKCLRDYMLVESK